MSAGAVLPMQEGNRVVRDAIVLSVDVRAEHFSPEIFSFVLAARRFCAFVEQAGSMSLTARLSNARLRLLEVYRAGCVLPSLDVTEEELGAPRSPNRSEAFPDFEQYEAYWEVFDPYVEAPLCTGLLSDDVLDIRADLCPGLALWDRGQYRAAVWEWRFHFDSHWGDHAVDALRALHRACRQDGQA